MSQAKYPLPLLCVILKFIQKNYQSQISLREIAQAVELSPSYLTDLVRQETGKTILGWIKEYRMAKARQLLSATNYSIEQIIEAVGYFDRRHFNRQFLQIHQLTPQGWRDGNYDYTNLLQIKTRYGQSNLTTQQALRLQVCIKEMSDIFKWDTVAKESIIWDIKHDCIAIVDCDSIQVVFECGEYALEEGLTTY